jgi:hypothetical protein
MARLANNHSLSQRRKLITFIISHLILGFGALALGVFLVIDSPTKDLLFWISVILEIGLAFIALLASRYSRTIPLLILIFSMLVPGILAANISSLNSISGSIYICVCTLGAILLFVRVDRRSKNKPLTIKSHTKVTFKPVFPTDLPSGFTEEHHQVHKNKQRTFLEISYNNIVDESWLLIYESNGEIIVGETKAQIEKMDKTINGIYISVEQIIPKRKSFLNKHEMLLLKATWKHNKIFFDSRSGGISMENFEKIIGSMIE